MRETSMSIYSSIAVLYNNHCIHCINLHYRDLYCTVLYCIVLHYITEACACLTSPCSLLILRLHSKYYRLTITCEIKNFSLISYFTFLVNHVACNQLKRYKRIHCEN